MKTLKKIAARIKSWDRGTLVVSTGLTLGLNITFLVVISQMKGFNFWGGGPLGFWFGVLGGCIGIASGQWMARLGSFEAIEGRGAMLLGPVQGCSWALSVCGAYNFAVANIGLSWQMATIHDFPLAAIASAVVGMGAAPVAHELGTIYPEPEPVSVPRTRQPSNPSRR